MKSVFTKLPAKKRVEVPNKLRRRGQAKKDKLSSNAHLIEERTDNKSREVARLGAVMSFLMEENVYTRVRCEEKEGHLLSTLTGEELAFLANAYKDLNIAHFIMIFQNPDKLIADGKQDSSVMVDCKMAFEWFQHIFGAHSGEKKLDESDEVAFYLSFLSIRDEKEGQAELVAEVERAFDIIEFFRAFNYFNVDKFQLESMIENYAEITELKERDSSLLTRMKEMLAAKEGRMALPMTLLQDLKAEVTNDFKNWLSLIVLNHFQGRRISALFSHFRKVGKLVSQFGHIFIGDAINFISDQINTLRNHGDQENRPKDILLRRMKNGGHIQVLLHEEDRRNDLHINVDPKPGDFKHLLRNMVIYKLGSRGKLVVRQFISDDLKGIYVIVKAIEVELRNIHSKFKINNETEIGAVDLFSLEPVDRKLRPLRLHSYIQEISFRRKYGLVDYDGSVLLRREEEDRVENNLAQELASTMKLNEDELRVEVIKLQSSVDIVYSQISEDLSLDYIRNNNIQDEASVSELQWQSYLIFQKLLLENYKKVKEPSSRRTKARVLIENQSLAASIGMVYRLIFLRSTTLANRTVNEHCGLLTKLLNCELGNTEPLKSIWQQLSIPQFSPYIGLVSQKGLSRVYRKSELNELRVRTPFKEADSLILVNKVITSLVNVKAATKNELLTDYYPCHNPFLLRGIKVQPFLEGLLGPVQLGDISAEEKKAQTVLSYFEDVCWDGDFGLHPIEELMAFKLMNPVYVPLPVLNNYLGNKLALMFYFLQSYIQNMKFFLVLAFVLQCMLWASTSTYFALADAQLKRAIDGITILFSFVVVGWTAQFNLVWERAEEEFQVKFGTTDVDQALGERQQFKGKFVRNKITDQLNFRSDEPVLKSIRLWITAVVNFGFVLVTVMVILLIFYLKKYMIKSSCCPDSVVVNLPTVLISISTVAFTKVYSLLAGSLTIFQNHKDLQQYENSKILNSYLVQFISNFNSIFFFSFLNSYFPGLGLCRVDYGTFQTNDCSVQVSSQMLSTFMVKLVLNVMQVVLPLVFFGMNYVLREGNDIRFAYNEFQSVEHFVEEQNKLIKYQSDEQIDGTLEDYMKVIIDFSYISFFGLSLPLSFILAFVSGIFQLHLVKVKLLFLVKRPVPVKASTIGFWKNILSTISLVGLVVNLFYIIYTREAFNNVSYYVILVVLFLFIAVRIVSSSYVLGSRSQHFKQLVQRQKASINQLVLKASSQSIKKVIRQRPVNLQTEEEVFDESFNKLVKNLDIHKSNPRKHAQESTMKMEDVVLAQGGSKPSASDSSGL